MSNFHFFPFRRDPDVSAASKTLVKCTLTVKEEPNWALVRVGDGGVDMEQARPGLMGAYSDVAHMLPWQPVMHQLYFP